MELVSVPIEKPETINFVLGQSHFIKTVEDIHEFLVTAVPGIAFGLAFNEASGPRLIRYSGTDDEMIALAKKNALTIGAGHCFILFLKNVFPVSILNGLKQIPEVCRIFCATANPTHVLIAENAQGRGIIGVVDGRPPLRVENEDDISQRVKFLRDIGYKQ
ncbi:adenosine-specific kinase [bacterium]|nr:adenosine-specific kinase [bacterium]